MAEDIKNVANVVVEDVLNGVSSKMNRAKGGADDDKLRQRSLLCVLFTPSMSFLGIFQYGGFFFYH